LFRLPIGSDLEHRPLSFSITKVYDAAQINGSA